jgi:SPP1 family predicted phage head-tail adaptor
MINAGKYNKKIEILGIKPVKDKGGFKKDEEYIVLKTYASIKTTRGYALIQNDSDFEKAYTNFTIRYPQVNISRDMIIKYNSKTYTIEYLNDIDEKHIELEIQAKLVNK